MAYRISNEDGREASARNFGRLALAIIPWALAIGASAWLGFYVGVNDMLRSRAQERRAAIAVGVSAPLEAPIVIDLKSRQTYCAPVTKADLDGEVLRLYVTNNCRTKLSSLEWHYDALSPDGTIIDSNSISDWHCEFPALRGDSAECVFGRKEFPSTLAVSLDNRIAKIRVWTVPHREGSR